MLPWEGGAIPIAPHVGSAQLRAAFHGGGVSPLGGVVPRLGGDALSVPLVVALQRLQHFLCFGSHQRSPRLPERLHHLLNETHLGGSEVKGHRGGGQGSWGEEGVTVGLGVGGQWVVGAGMGVVVSVPPVDVETQRRHLGDPTPPPPHPWP